MVDIDVYPTRMEISPWVFEKDDTIVRACSTTYDKTTHRREVIGCQYLPEEKKLVVMRGLDVNWLIQSIGGYPNYHEPSPIEKMKKQYKMKVRPRDNNQLRAIKFLCGYGEFTRNQRYSQLSLNTEPNFGKTYCAIAAALEGRKRTLVIVHNSVVKDQWKKSILEKSDMPVKRIIDITGTDEMVSLMESKVDADFILMMHQSITAYHTAYGYKALMEWFDHLRCGLKIIDEAHLFFLSTSRIDLSSNIAKTYYLTGTMTRSNPLEVALFRRYFSSTASFGADLEKTRNVIYEFVDFDSYPAETSQGYILTSRGVNSSRYIKYAFQIDPSRCLIKVIKSTMMRCVDNGGKTLVILPTIDTCEEVTSIISKMLPDKLVMPYHSKCSDKITPINDAEVIVSTISSLGTGTDIDGLRNMIIADLYSSEVTANQLPKRLGRGTNEECYVYELVDNGFESIRFQVAKKTRYLKKCCKKVRHSTFNGDI